MSAEFSKTSAGALTADMSSDQISERANSFLASLSSSTRIDVENKIRELKMHQDLGLLSPEMYVGKTVLDWEAGLCGFSAAFYCLGAKKIIAIDSWVESSNLPEQFLGMEGFLYRRTSVLDFVGLGLNDEKIDLIFSNTVTEHIGNLPEALSALNRLMSDSGYYLNVHDNYYSPCGSHDHGFWFYGEGGAIDFQGVKCWSAPEKCAHSNDHRQKLLVQMPWTWNSRLEQKRDPQDCQQCPYYRRSQPWGHLAAVNEFVETFDDPSFLTWRAGSSLNKATTFQMRQLLVEAGFQVLGFHRNRCTNQPPEALIDAGFSPLELTTTTSVWLSSKRRAAA